MLAESRGPALQLKILRCQAQNAVKLILKELQPYVALLEACYCQFANNMHGEQLQAVIWG